MYGVGKELGHLALVDVVVGADHERAFFWQGGVPPFALSREPVAEAICFALGQPADVDLNTLTIRPVGQPV
ncbi:hypothetical protein ACWCOT_07130 [Nonomuraea bangladeshensis]